eukprot:1289636-Alexandrium_andersonii.AAC.1
MSPASRPTAGRKKVSAGPGRVEPRLAPQLWPPTGPTGRAPRTGGEGGVDPLGRAPGTGGEGG